MNIVLSGGGTAGHINPALALADVLQEQGHKVYYAGTPEGVEARLVKLAGIDFTAFEAAGFDREKPLTLITSTLKIFGSVFKARKWMKEIKPDVVVGFGGYVSIPVGLASIRLNIPLVVHEQNSVMGMANKFMSEWANAVALTYDVAAKDVADKDKVVVTGNPVRASVIAATREEGRDMLGIPQDATMLLVFGGSLGARHINQAVAAMKQQLLAIDNLYVVQITGPKLYDETLEMLNLSEEESKRWQVLSYQDRMAQTLAASDCSICRAGATSLAEISALGLPALLVPYPLATEDHQTTNAQAYVASGAAFMMADDELDNPEFSQMLMRLVTEPELRAEMRQAAASFKTQDAAANLAKVVLSQANQAH